MFVVDGVDNVYCERDLCRLFSLVLASLDSMLTLTFSLLGMCWMLNSDRVVGLSFDRVVGFVMNVKLR